MSAENIAWELPGDLIRKSVEAMRPHGLHGNEGLALWFGREEAGRVSVAHLVVPYGTGLVTNPLHLSLSLRAISRVTRLADELDCYWLGQIHSHPGQMLDLSDVDKRMGVRVQDYLSVVCPYYAQRDTRTVDECGVHMFDQGRYRWLKSREVTKYITVTGQSVEVVNLEVHA